MYHAHRHHHHVHSWSYCSVCQIKYCECGEERRIYTQPWVAPYIPWDPFPNKIIANFGLQSSHSH